MVDVTIRHRVLLEPRGFIRLIEFILAIVAFATTGGYTGTETGRVKCSDDDEPRGLTITISYPFNLQGNPQLVPTCASNGSQTYSKIYLKGDFSPAAQWFVFVGVMAFLISLASIIFYVAFETSFRAMNEFAVTVGDFVVTIIWALLWLTAASAWAWGIGQVKTYSTTGAIFKDQMTATCGRSETNCNTAAKMDYSPLNASVAFAFLSFFVWVGNVWFVYKETPYHKEPDSYQEQGQPDASD